MRTARLTILALAVAVVAIGVSTNTFAFHSGGVGECVGCHSMHDPVSSSYLLQGTDQSSTCLNCHVTTSSNPSSYHVLSDDILLSGGNSPTQRTPGGDFGWLKKTYSWSVPWGTFTEEGETHGHNVVAADFGLAVDSTGTAPGGTFPSGQLGCEDCHNPHGKYRRDANGTISTTGLAIKASGSYHNSPDPDSTAAVGVYRLLNGSGFVTDGVQFQTSPAIVVNSSYNRSEAVNQTRVAYGDNIGAWCATCHPDMHNTVGGTAIVHPIDEDLGSSIVDIYERYRGSGDLTGLAGDSYLSLVPFEEDIGGTHTLADYATLKSKALIDNSDLSGPATTSDVTCLSCHRAHASGWEYALRWNPESELITYNGLWPGTDNGAPVQFARGRTEAEYEDAMNDYPASTFGAYQRQLCNKCHAQD